MPQYIKKSEWNIFKSISFDFKFSSNFPNGLFGINLYKTPESYWYVLLTRLPWASVISSCGTCSPILSFIILLSVLSCSFIVSGVESSG